ncbi:MAG: ABC transporter permease [Candidatus Omnitrophica bacterium]|nr:ABC transporter permease [Candidatus Omnitrophota bacterium]
MSKVFIIIKKELATLFRSPLAYVILCITISVFHFFFYLIIDHNQEASLRDVFKVMEFMFVFIVPILTMKTFAGEKLSGTMEFLLTTPTSHLTIVLGKFLGVFTFFSVLVGLTGIYYVLIEIFGNPDLSAVMTGYLGVLLEGGLFIAIGILVSSWTSSQMIAAITTYLLLFILYFSASVTTYFQGAMAEFLRQLCTMTHFDNFSIGLFSLADFVYYASGIVMCLLLTCVSIDKKLWE